MQVNLHNQIALVTGAAQGIGQAIADALAANGAKVVYADVNAEGAAAAAHGRPGAFGLRMDVTSSAEIDAAIEKTVQQLGRLDIVVNNAGVNTLAHRVTIDEFPREEWDRILSVDLTGLFDVSRAAARVMKRQASGKIINIASIAGLVPLRLQCAFVAAKAGVVNLTRAMALELAPHGILVNAIAPGSTLTEGTRKLFYGEDGKFRDSVQRLLDHIPLARPGTVEEIAHAALFLAAPESSYITGHTLVVDGGWTAGGFVRDF
jgi:NAD(P)-dependent dehydrogenase (short-subunit alcohol dehydrogenase family)